MSKEAAPQKAPALHSAHQHCQHQRCRCRCDSANLHTLRPRHKKRIRLALDVAGLESCWCAGHGCCHY